MSIVFREERFLSLLGSFMQHVEKLQNHPPDHVPQEELVFREIEAYLKPYTDSKILKLDYHSYTPGRGNAILTYAGTTDAVISFVGSHMDVVPADPKVWERNPFKLERVGDKIFGRGVTDCLGHVALLTDLFAQLAEQKPSLKTSVVAVFICNEENSSVQDIGVEALNQRGLISHLSRGPMFWVDCADTDPCIGTAAAMTWQLTARGRIFHSGLQHLAINAIELVNDAILEIQRRFYEDFPKHEQEAAYFYPISSTLKPTAVAYPGGGLNQIPGECTLKGDIRLTPFYDVAACQSKIESYVRELNTDINSLTGKRGPFSKYTVTTPAGEVLSGSLELSWLGPPYEAIACKIDSPGYKAMLEATTEVVGSAKPYSITGSLPLVKELQDSGFDLQLVGYGESSAYHANNEWASLTRLDQGIQILGRLISKLNQ